mgnify:CR=1 FL=1
MAQGPEQCVVAQEAYNHQDGFHIHIFYRLKHQAAFKPQLNYWVTFWKSGRVQVDVMKGQMDQACKYLVADKTQKDKFTDSSPFFHPTKEIVKSPQEAYVEWANELLDWCLNPDREEERKEYYRQRDILNENFKRAWRESMLKLKSQE